MDKKHYDFLWIFAVSLREKGVDLNGFQYLKDFMGFNVSLREKGVDLNIQFANPVNAFLSLPSWEGSGFKHTRIGVIQQSYQVSLREKGVDLNFQGNHI